MTDPDISVRCEEDCSTEKLDILMMRSPSIAGVRTEFVGSDPCFALMAGKRRNEATERGGALI